ncbi:folate-sensitive fragile site protein Fra10Ac1-domain-containing protein [Crepidotus variabilis]|uniref:Folate-sensitive fragile site protein Fra10Ac1-domain-containing protein n=1 Tax=Crepidotus variabilis TaxID=179855 RepID=A0A9P6JN17_9AGAR|nr:folate-sensitive fragile site protein Fra10Ac1-domain-containing protein [Crepidotus variabilis]
MALYKRPPPPKPPTGLTEFEILKSSHKFLRDDEDKPSTWDDHLAAKYYSSLYREFAVCDLKHYKSGNFALRWRTEEEVLAGSAETTCGNTRCKHHYASSSTGASLSLDRLLQRNAVASSSSSSSVPLTTLELPFTYIEQGESKSALVKVVLCGKCSKKLMWKKTKEKEQEVLETDRGKEGSSRSFDGEAKDQVETKLPLKRKHSSDDRKDRVPPEDDDDTQRRKKRRQEDDKKPSSNKRRHRDHSLHLDDVERAR